MFATAMTAVAVRIPRRARVVVSLRLRLRLRLPARSRASRRSSIVDRRPRPIAFEIASLVRSRFVARRRPRAAPFVCRTSCPLSRSPKKTSDCRRMARGVARRRVARRAR